MSNELTAQSQVLQKNADSIVIDSAETMTSGTELLSQANKVLDKVKKEKETVLKPLREATKVENSRWKPLEDQLKPIVAMLREKLGAYQTAEMNRKRAEEEKIAARMKPGSGNLKAGTAIKQMANIDSPEEKVTAQSGGLSFREKKVLKITDEKLIPKQYWIIDEDAVLAALKEGKKVKGAEITIEMTPVNKR